MYGVFMPSNYSPIIYLDFLPLQLVGVDLSVLQ